MDRAKLGSEIANAYGRISGKIVRTPVVELTGLGLPRPVVAKLEHLQHTGSFKARGAFNSVLSMEVPQAGFVAASGGNHGAAVAFAATQAGHKAQIFVPEFAGPAKIGAIERTGADLTVVPGAYANALAAAQEYEAQTGAAQIHAYDAWTTVAGQGTLGLEWLDQGLEADTVLISVGGGGLISGIVAALGDRAKVVAVETDQTSALHSAIAAGQPVPVEVGGIAANALGARQIGDIAFEMCRGLHSILVSDAAVAEAQSTLWSAHRLAVEPAAAAGLAALQSGAYVPEPGERVALLLCGANIDGLP